MKQLQIGHYGILALLVISICLGVILFLNIRETNSLHQLINQQSQKKQSRGAGLK